MEPEGLLDPGANYVLPFAKEPSKLFQSLQKPKRKTKKQGGGSTSSAVASIGNTSTRKKSVVKRKRKSPPKWKAAGKKKTIRTKAQFGFGRKCGEANCIHSEI